ncbi:MAG: DUF4956 domain-containing protein [Reichenbachiella sp.]|uniref:DUF4956 domain-containing protein n=1 Tax=Reichenbachiella sp. TaxID=2184521 RepID=UPI00326645D4
MNKNTEISMDTWDGLIAQIQSTSSVDYDFGLLLIRLLINLSAVLLLIWLIHKRNRNTTDFYFSYFAIGMTVFLLCFLLSNVKLELGFALGLFAIFGIIRYRTDAIPIKEMSFLFVVIGMSVVNALVDANIGVLGLVLINAIIVLGLWGIDKTLVLNNQQSLPLLYEKIENIHPDKSEVLLEDLRERTGLQITSVDILEVDYLRDVAQLTVYHGRGSNSKIKKS